MPRNDGRLEPGQKLNGAISARAWNRMLDASDLVLGDSNGVTAGTAFAGDKPYSWVYCKPSFTVARWGVVAITGVDITPTATESDTATMTFQDSPVVTGGTPSSSTTSWGVAIEPIASGSIGRLAVAGVVQCKIEVDKSDDKFVACASGGLKSGVKGESLILWKESGTGSGKWALVRLGTTATTEVDIITGVTIGSSGLVFTKETVYVVGKKTPKPSDITISTTACT